MKTEKSSIKRTAKASAAKVETAPVKETETVTKKAETKAETTVKAAPEKENSAKKAPEKAAPVKVEETAKKAPAKKTAAKKAEIKETIYLQYLGKEIDKDDIMKQIKEIWTKQLKKKVGDIKAVAIYLKPEENAAYYVINGDVTGSVDL